MAHSTGSSVASTGTWSDSDRRAGSRSTTRTALRTTARVGLVARGFVYGLIGVLALELALGVGGRTESQSGALKTIAAQPFGKVLLILLAIGLAAYAVWRLIEAAAGARLDEDGASRRRLSALASGVAYAVLCYSAIKIIVGGHASSGSPKPATAGVLGWPAGPVIVAIAGAVVVGVGLYQLYKGISRKFEEESDLGHSSARTRDTFVVVGVTGYVARGVTFLVIGYGLVKAALDYSPNSAVGLDGALQKLAHSTLGPFVLGVVALGFVAFAAYSIMDVRYHKV
jgi:hypothetical protein